MKVNTTMVKNPKYSSGILYIMLDEPTPEEPEEISVSNLLDRLYAIGNTAKFTTLQEIKDRFDERSTYFQVTQSVYNNKKRSKLDRDRRIRKKRAYQNLAAELVYRMRKRVQENEPDTDSKTVCSLDGFCTECNVHHINFTGSTGIVRCLESPRR